MITLLVLIAGPLLICAVYTIWRVRQFNRDLTPDGQFAEVDGVKLHYHFYPAATGAEAMPVLVFLHGASGNAYDTRLAFQEALKGRYPLLFVDRPGLGFSETNGTSHNTPERQAQCLDGLLDTLGVEEAVVVGHSLGGTVAAALGLASPDRVKGLAFVAPVSHPWPGGVNWYYSVAALPLVGKLFCWTLVVPIAEKLAPCAISSVFLPDRPPKNYAEEIKVPLSFRPDAFQANARDITRLKSAVIAQSKRYPSLQQPALIVTGTQDGVVWPSIHCEGLLKDLPNAELMIFDNAGHMPHHTHTAMIVPALERLIRRVRFEGQCLEIPGHDQRPLEQA